MKAKFVIIYSLPDIYDPQVVVFVESFQCSDDSNIGVYPAEE